MNPVARRVARAPFFYGWAVASATSITVVGAMTFAVSTFSAFVDPISEEFGWSRTAISGAIAAGTIGAAVAGPIMGHWADRYGARVLLTVGSVLMGVALFGLGTMGSLPAFFIFYGLGRMMMMNLEHLVAPTVMANWFIRRRAMATALVMASSRVGLGLWPTLAGVLFVVRDWRFAMFLMGSFLLAQAVVPWLFIVSRRPEDVGMWPDGDEPVETEAGMAAVEEPSWSAREAVRTQAFWMLMIASSITLFVGGGVGLHRVPYLVGKGMPDYLVGPVLIGFAAGMAIGGIIVARLSRYVSERDLMALLMVYTFGLMSLLLLVPPNVLAVPYGFADGMAFGAMLTLQPVLYARFYGRDSVGTIRGLAQPVLLIGNAAGTLFGGVLFDATGGEYTWVFVTFAGLMLVGAAVARAARVPRRAV